MEQYLTDNSIYVVLGIVLLIWAGIIMYLFSVDRKVKKFEKELEENKELSKGRNPFE
ncbi:MAG: CcmD family protein [Bacteroidota bacterium]